METRYDGNEISRIMVERDHLASNVARQKDRRSLVKTLVCALGVAGGIFAMDNVFNKSEEREYAKRGFQEQRQELELPKADSRDSIPVYRTPIDEKLMEELRQLPPAPYVLPNEPMAPRLDRKGPLIQQFPNGRTTERPHYTR